MFGILLLVTDIVSANVEEVITDSEQEQILENKEVKVSTSSLVTTIEELQEILASFEVEKTLERSLTNKEEKEQKNIVNDNVYTVPFYSQFADISSPSWQKVGCGIASLAMLIDFYSDDIESVDELLNRGLSAGAFLRDAGWIHQGLINLASKYDLTGESVSLSLLSLDDAFSELEKVLSEGPVMASVHYTFESTNPIPHLVVINGVKDGKVFYNDPAETNGGGSLSVEKFKQAWKKRYIEIRPV